MLVDREPAYPNICARFVKRKNRQVPWTIDGSGIDAGQSLERSDFDPYVADGRTPRGLAEVVRAHADGGWGALRRWSRIRAARIEGDHPAGDDVDRPKGSLELAGDGN